MKERVMRKTSLRNFSHECKNKNLKELPCQHVSACSPYKMQCSCFSLETYFQKKHLPFIFAFLEALHTDMGENSKNNLTPSPLPQRGAFSLFLLLLISQHGMRRLVLMVNGLNLFTDRQHQYQTII